MKLDFIKKSIGELHKSIRKIHINPTISGVEKRQLIDSAYYKMNEIAKAGNKIVEQFKDKEK